MTDVFQERRRDYVRWHPAQVASKDIDPVYPVLSGLADRWKLDADQRAWLVFSHVIWYHPGSTLAGFALAPSPSVLPPDGEGLAWSGLLDLPCLTERRSHRPKQPLINHLLDLREKLGEEGPWAWVNKAAAGSSPKQRWLALNEALTTIVGNGRWASYKTAEMLQKVCGLDVEAADAGHRYSSGPRKGLALLEYNLPTDNSPATVRHLDFLTEVWADVLDEPDIAQVETSLCDFNSLVHGRYYLGHDIDSMLASWKDPRVSRWIPSDAWEVRTEVFEERFLGELGGWDGVRKELNTRYRDEGELYGID